MNKGKKILFGRDTEENIVKIETIYNKKIVQIFSRVNGELKSRYEPLDLFVFANDKQKLHGNYETKKLLGNNYYNLQLEFPSARDFFNFKRKYYKDINVPYGSSQYFLQTGKTVFKGMKFDDPLVLYFDIETITTEGYNFPNASRKGDKIVIIALKTNRGDKMLFYLGDAEIKDEGDTTHYVCKNEKELIKEFIYQFRSIDPDIVANHNIFNFDLPYLEERANIHGVNFALGRDGTEPKTFETNIKFGDRMRSYTNYVIYGRDVIDTQFLAEYADVVLRKMPSYRLKDLVKFLGKATDDRTYIEGGDISDVWKNKHDKFTRKDLIKYAIEDVVEAEILYNEYGQSIFILAQMVPMNFQEVFRYGTGNQIEYVFNREYIYNNWSLPKPSEHQSIKGGYADVLKFGHIKGSIIYADVKSLYPSLAKILEIQPKKDELKIFQLILQTLTNIRYEIKDKIKQYSKEGKDDLIAQQKATDGSVKIFLNTMSYGFLAFSHSGFNDFDEAERITTTGQEIVKEMIDIINKDGGEPIKVDTDGVALLMPEDWIGREEEYCEERLTDALRDGIIIECDGKFDGILSFDRKSYALLNKDGSIKLKGNTITGRGVERFVHDIINHTIEYLFGKKDKHPNDLYYELKDKIKRSDFEPEEIQKRSSLNMSLSEYRMRRDSGNTNTLVQYELADKAVKPYSKGDIILYYVKRYPYEMTTYRNKPTVRKKKCKVYEAGELIENYDNDIEPEYYIDRLDKGVKKFMVLGKNEFEDLFDVEVKKSDITRIKKITKQNYDK